MASTAPTSIRRANEPRFLGAEAALILAEVGAMVCLRTAAKAKAGGRMDYTYTGLGVASYVFVALTFRHLLRYAPISLANAVWDAGAIVVTTLLGVVVYKEKFKPIEYVGLALAVGALGCMLIGAAS